MFLKITRSGPRQYLQLVEAFRDDAGKAKHRTLVTLGRLDQLTESLDSVISGLLKVTGRPDFLNAPLPAVEFKSAVTVNPTAFFPSRGADENRSLDE